MVIAGGARFIGVGERAAPYGARRLLQHGTVSAWLRPVQQCGAGAAGRAEARVVGMAELTMAGMAENWAVGMMELPVATGMAEAWAVGMMELPLVAMMELPVIAETPEAWAGSMAALACCPEWNAQHHSVAWIQKRPSRYVRTRPLQARGKSMPVDQLYALASSVRGHHLRIFLAHTVQHD